MYKGFNLSINDGFFVESDYYKKGKSIYEKHKDCVFSCLTEILENKIIDGDTLQAMYFPDELFFNKRYVFISHSHQDETLAIKLAGYLYQKFAILSFIDSCVWRHMDDLSIELNGCTKNCYHCCCGDFSYNLSYVHMMLASALMKVIDKSECLFFLNTPSSININEKTESPWLYYELNIANIIRKKSKLETLTENENVFEYKRRIELTPNLEDMCDINEKVIRNWEREYSKSHKNPYEILYNVCGG